MRRDGGSRDRGRKLRPEPVVAEGTPSSEASLERLIEDEDLGLEVLHPGGLETTAELAALCEIGPESRVLDVASGTGESACFLAGRFGAPVTGLERSSTMIRRARAKARDRGRSARFVRGDAHDLPFGAGSFEAAICECTLSLLDQARALPEMVRVVRSGGHIGFHEICWKEGTPEEMKRRLYELEGEWPRTLREWEKLMAGCEVTDVHAFDRSSLIPGWMKRSRRELGARGLLAAGARVIREWGVGGLRRVLESERIFRSEYLCYGMVVARKT